MSKVRRLNTNILGIVCVHIKEFPFFYIGALICLTITHYVQSYLPFLAKEFAESIDKGISFNKIHYFFFIAIAIILFRTLSRLLFFYPARMMQKFLRVELLNDLESTPPHKYSSFSAGQIFQIIGNDIDQIRALCGFALLQFGNIIIALAVLLPQIAKFESKLIVALTPLLIGFLLFSIIVVSTRKYWRQTQDYQGEVQNILMETYNGKSTIKNFHVENKFIELFNKYCGKELQSFYKSGIGVAVSMPFIPLGVGLSLVWGAKIIFDLQLGANALILFSGFIFLFLEPMMFVSWIGIVVTSSISSWSRIVELRNEIYKEDIHIESMSVLEANDLYKIKIKFWLKDLECRIKKNSINVFIGETGCGKTYVVDSLALILKQNKKNITYVSQHPYLYNDTIKDNLFLGNEQSPEQITLAKELLDLFGLSFLAPNMEALLDLVVGENGKKVSGGQAKRIALIRSLLQPSEIIIWDDPFSSVDLILEKEILANLKNKNLLQNKTLILTSHRLTTVRNSDYVYFLEKENGLKEHGKAQDLLKKQTKTYEFFESQLV